MIKTIGSPLYKLGATNLFFNSFFFAFEVQFYKLSVYISSIKYAVVHTDKEEVSITF